MDLQERFCLFCENAEITLLENTEVQHGMKYKVSKTGEEAYMTLYHNGNSLPQGHQGSHLLNLLQVWSNVRPGKRDIPEDEKSILDNWGVPGFYMSWREWWEDANIISDYIKENGEPNELQAVDGYKMHREIMFHDYMFKKATDLKISIEVVRQIIINWVTRFCFMNIDSALLADMTISKITKDWHDDITPDGYVPFYDVLDDLTYVFCRFCHDKWVVDSNNRAVCPQMGDIDICIIELVDSMYVYCQNQHVLSYTKTNMHHLLRRELDKLSWIDLRAQSPIENTLGNAIYQAGILTIPQYQALAPDRRFKLDFMIKTPNGGALAIECDGLEYHANPKAYINDRRRDNLLTSNGFQVLRFSSVDILQDLEGCIKQIEYSFSNFQHGKVVYHRNHGIGYFGAQL